jgi:predicted nucleic acid-binding protein
MYLLDTNVVSELRKPSKGKRVAIDRNVSVWAAGVAVNVLFISSITILEIETGILLAERKDRAKGDLLRVWLEAHVLTAFAGRILPVDLAVARKCVGLHVPDRMEDRDALIAATALVHGMTIVTRNVGDFEPSGVPMINPWLPR